MKAQINEFQSQLQAACEGTSVSTRELVKELSVEEIALIKSGDISLEEIKETVRDLADTKDNEQLYKVSTRKRAADESYEDNVTEVLE